MANEQNLKPIRSTEEAREKGKKGGKKSAETRKKKKLLKDCMEILLELPVKSNKALETMGKYGIDAEDMNNQMALTVALFSKAMTGDVSAFTIIRDTMGEKPKETVEIQDRRESSKKLDNILKQLKE